VTISYEREIDYKESAFREFLTDYFYHEIILSFFPSYKRLGRKQIFSPERSINLKEHDVEIWQGFRYEVRTEITTPSYGSQNGPSSGLAPMLNIDVDFLVVRLETALDIVRETTKCLEQPNDTHLDDKLVGQVSQDLIHKEVRKQLVGKVVVTRYNNMLYRVKDVDFSLTPDSQFIHTII